MAMVQNWLSITTVLVTTMYCAQMAEPIEVPFAVVSGVGSKNHVLDGGPDPAWKRRFYFGGYAH